MIKGCHTNCFSIDRQKLAAKSLVKHTSWDQGTVSPLTLWCVFASGNSHNMKLFFFPFFFCLVVWMCPIYLTVQWDIMSSCCRNSKCLSRICLHIVLFQIIMMHSFILSRLPGPNEGLMDFETLSEGTQTVSKQCHSWRHSGASANERRFSKV